MLKQARTTYFPSGWVSRADLLRCLILAGEDNLQTIAELVGYKSPVKTKLEFKLPELPPDLHKPDADENPKPDQPATTATPIHYYRVIGRKVSKLLPEPKAEGDYYPDWYYQIPVLDVDSIKPANVIPPVKEPIIPWPKLWPVLQVHLSELKRSRQPDIPRLARMLANAELPAQIPRQVRQSWTAEVQLLIDRPERTELFNDDYNRLLEQLQRLRGNTGLQVQQILQRPGGVVRVRHNKTYRNQTWRLPEAGSAILILSDLGLLDRSEQALHDWLRFGKRLRNAGFVPTVLLPLPQRYLIPELVGLFDCVCWTRHSDLRPVSWVAPRQKSDDSPLQQDGQQAAADLLAWLSPAVRVEPALLRAVCHHLATTRQDGGIEAAAWLHEDVQATNIGFYYKPESIEKHRQRFKQLAKQNPGLAKQLVSLLRAYHAHVFPSQLHEEMLILAELMGDQLGDDYAGQIREAVMHWRQLLKALNENTQGASGLPGFTWHYFKRQHQAMYQDQRNQHLPAMQGVMLREYLQSPDELFPGGDSASHEALRLLMAFAIRPVSAIAAVLCQRGMQTLHVCSRQRYGEGEDGFTVGALLTQFRFTPQFILQLRRGADGNPEHLVLPLNADGIIVVNMGQAERQQLHIAGAELTMERFVKPDWAEAISCSHETLTVTTRSADNVFYWYWYPPEIGGQDSHERFNSQDTSKPVQGSELPGFWHYLPANDSSGLTPYWADTASRDPYGLYADVKIAGVTQRFRWIQPGSFMMGSPEQENGRYDNETLHQVNLRQGYWLADTACTQALWQAVMGKNPSNFEGVYRPVDNVSWKDVQQFLTTLSQQQPGLDLRLPSEAEWEYACRAGTTDSFNFEGELSLARVNYRGTWEFESDKWGEGALQQTAEVKSYPPNASGLYEMHGNVLEWCQDWYGDYPAQPISDPTEPDTGDSRVLRGGSWFYNGGYCRSAYRSSASPDYAYYTFGFRLARGHQSGQTLSGAAQQPDGTHAAVARGAQPGDGLRDAETKQQVNKTSSKKRKK